MLPSGESIHGDGLIALGFGEEKAVDQAADGVTAEYDGFFKSDLRNFGQPMGFH